jgi:hypothetical protein
LPKDGPKLSFAPWRTSSRNPIKRSAKRSVPLIAGSNDFIFLDVVWVCSGVTGRLYSAVERLIEEATKNGFSADDAIDVLEQALDVTRTYHSTSAIRPKTLRLF